MGTRAIYIFESANEEVAVYKHYDNYPQGAVDFIEKAKAYAWAFPRFEADEFAAAFVAANKNRKGGEVRLVSYIYEDRHALMEDYGWNDYYYVISYEPHHKDLWIEVWQLRYDMDSSDSDWVLTDELTHTEMKEKYGERTIAV